MTRRRPAAAAISETERPGHPHLCGCPECRAWRDFCPAYRHYREARRLRLWALYVRAFAVADPDTDPAAAAARAEFYAEVPLSRDRRRALEAETRRLRRKSARHGK